ncbi:MAG: DNRLRE domain-containing protein [Thermoanaerobaculia bacterium]
MRTAVTLLALVVVLAAVLELGALAAPQPGGGDSPPRTSVVLATLGDTTVKQSQPDTNFGGDAELAVSHDDLRGPREEVTLLRFDVSAAVPVEATIVSATLSLHLVDGAGADPVGLNVHGVTSSWNEGTVTWNTFPTAHPIGITWSMDASGGAKHLDVTSFAQSWHGGSNNGFYLRGPVDGTLYGRVFASREAGAGAPSLEVTYTLPTDTSERDRFHEESPPWSWPDLALSNLGYRPERPAPGDGVAVTVQLEHLGDRNPVDDAKVLLRIDGTVVDEYATTDIQPGTSRSIALRWRSATPGRHRLRVDVTSGDGEITETRTDNNTLVDWLRVSGGSEPLADIEVERIRLVPPAPRAGDDGTIEVDIRNMGYATASELPIRLTVDGREIRQLVIPSLEPGQAFRLSEPWAKIGEGRHVVALWVDPERLAPLAQTQTVWAREVSTTSSEYKLPLSNARGGEWEFIGPRPIAVRDPKYLTHVGRVNGFDVSQLAGRKRVMVAGTEGSGVWLTEDGGARWAPIADSLPSLNARTVALDPLDDRIVYASTAKGLYKSLDAGAHWDQFVDHDWLGTKYSDDLRLVLRYEQPGTLTVYYATRNGLWIWQGDPRAAKTKKTQWKTAWTQATHARAGRPADATNVVGELAITEEAAPHVYIAVRKDTVYRAKLGALLAGVAGGTPISWTPLPEKLASDGYLRLGYSKAAISRIYAAAKRKNGDLEIYSRDLADSQWTLRGTPDTKKCNPSGYIGVIAVHPTNPDLLYLLGVNGCRSSDGGKSYDLHIPSVHIDYKDMAFDPTNPSIVFFSSDGGMYRCTQNGEKCGSLNHDLETTMLFDIAMTGTITPILGGSQDTMAMRYDGKVAWKEVNAALGGDIEGVGMDRKNGKNMYAAAQYTTQLHKSTDGGKKWASANGTAPFTIPEVAHPKFVVDPDDWKTVLVAANGVYRTTDGGQKWKSIGPAKGMTGGLVQVVAIDGANDRYYAGTGLGQLWAVAAAAAGPTKWTRIYRNPHGRGTRTIVVDPVDPDTLWITHGGGEASRVARVSFGGTTWPGAEADWADASLAGTLAGERRLAGGLRSEIRGLIKDPTRQALYIGTDRGVYRGVPVGGHWKWVLDSCGLPLASVSDLEMHPSGLFMVAATLGRGAYKRPSTNIIPPPDAYDTPVRNDDETSATHLGIVQETISKPGLGPGLSVSGLNLDSTDDIDFFTVQLPPLKRGDCLAPGDPSLNDPRTRQCGLTVTVQAANTPDPFELRLHPGAGAPPPTATVSKLSIDLARPHDLFPTGRVTLSARGLTKGCHTEYALNFWYNTTYSEIAAPPILFDPPFFNWVLPALGDFDWLFPADPELIDRGFVGQAPDPLPEQRAVFRWESAGDFLATVSVEGTGHLEATLYDSEGNSIAEAIPLGQSGPNEDAPPSRKRQIHVSDMPPGWYAVGFGRGSFPTYFTVTFDGLTDPVPGRDLGQGPSRSLVR